MAALINTIQINNYKQQCQRTLRTNQVCAYSEVRSVVSQPKCHQIKLFSWILDDGRAPATGIRRVNLEPTDGNISPVSVRSALFKVAGYPGNFSRRACGHRRRPGAARSSPPPPHRRRQHFWATRGAPRRRRCGNVPAGQPGALPPRPPVPTSPPPPAVGGSRRRAVAAAPLPSPLRSFPARPAPRGSPAPTPTAATAAGVTANESTLGVGTAHAPPPLPPPLGAITEPPRGVAVTRSATAAPWCPHRRLLVARRCDGVHRQHRPGGIGRRQPPRRRPHQLLSPARAPRRPATAD